MKTSKILLSSLLAAAAMSTVPAWATNYTVTGAFTGDYTNDNITGTIDGTAKKTVSVTSTDTLTFSGATSGYFPRWSGGTFAGNIIIADGGSITITNGGSATYMVFSGSLSGAGTFSTNYNNDPAIGQDFIFTGDLTSFTGTFTRPNANFNASGTDYYNAKETGILQFGGTVVSSNKGIGAGTAYAASATAGEDGIVHNISGTGTITTSSVLRYNYTGSANDGVSSLGVDNSTISARYIDFRGGANYTVSSTVTGSDSTASNNTLTISAGTTTFTGAVSNFGNIVVASDATLAFSGAKVALTSAITNSGTVNVDTNTVFVLADALKNDSTYTVISGGTISGWDSLTISNFRQSDGSTFGRSAVDVSTTAGAVTTTEEAASLTWNGGSSGGTWDVQTTKNWLNNGSEDVFYTSDNVTFSSDAAITVASSGVKAGTMTVSEGTSVVLSGGTVSATSLSSAGTVSLNEDAGISITSKLTAKADFSKVSGAGTISVIGGLDSGYGVTLGSGFTGTLYVTKDSADSRLLLSDSSLGTAKILVGSGADLAFNGTGTNVSNDITFEGDSTIHANSGKTGTLSGKVSSTGTLTKDGAGTLTIAGAGTSISDLRISNGTLNITAGEATIKGNQTLVGNLTIGGNATVYAGASDSLKYSDVSNTITVNEGGTLDLGNYRWSVGSGTKIVLAGGTIKGTGETDKGALDFYLSGTVTAKTNTESEISANLRIRKDSNSTATETFSTETGAKLLISGKVIGGGDMIKSGEGTLTLTGENTYAGGTTISKGTLVAGSASALGTGKTKVAADAKLGLIAGTTVTVNGGIELATGAKIVVDMSSISKAETFTLELLTTSALSYNGESITSDNVGTLLTDGVVSLSGWKQTGWTKSLSYADNTLSLTLTIPEPSTFGLLAGVGALALVAARRRRRAK